MKNLFVFFVAFFALALLVSGCASMPNSAHTDQEYKKSATSSLKVFKDDVLELSVSYLPGLIPLVKEDDGLADGGFLAGKKRGIYFSKNEGEQLKPFAVAFTSDYQFPPTAGCCFSYSGKPVNLELSIEELNKTLKFPHLDNIKKINIGGRDTIRFTGFGEDESGFWLAEYALMPFEKNGFSNLLFFGPQIYYVASDDQNYVAKIEKMKTGEFEVSASAKIEIEEFDKILESIVFVR